MSAPSVGSVACSITGQPDKRPQNITLRNVELLFKGGGRAEDAAQKIVEEYPARYPAPFLVFETMFPAYAFYLRHADGIRFENVKLEVLDPDEARPPIVADDATYELTSAIGARAGDPGPWAGKKVAFLGDSITDPDQTNRPQRVYWQYLADSLGLEPHVYAVSGYQWNRVYESAQKMKDEMGQSVDAIFVFAGTNDYMNGIPLGEWFEEAPEETYLKGRTLTLPRRRLVKDMTTFKGRVNTVMEFLKTNFPDQQIVIMTPLHRGKYDLGRPNVQLDETFPNALGRRLEEYVAALREAADIWSVPVIDLYRESGLYPLSDSYAKCFRYDGPKLWDRLHPNQEGHRRLAKTIAAKLTAIPPDFKPGKDAN